MKKTGIIIFLLASLVSNAQPNWKDSVKIKQEVLDAYKVNDIIYFQTKKGWGAYWPVQDYVALEPAYQFVLEAKGHEMNYFYVVKKNKLMIVDNKGRQLNKKAYFRVGELEPLSEKRTIEDDALNTYMNDTLLAFGSYFQLSSFTERSLTIFNKYVLVNIFDEATEPIPYRVDLHGDFVDSVDALGNLVYQSVEPFQMSGVYDLSAKKWVVPMGVAKVGICGTNILVRKTVKRDAQFDDEFLVLDNSLQQIGKFKYEEILDKPEVNKIVLSSFKPVLVERCFNKGSLRQLFRIDTGEKQGLFDPFTFNFLFKPDKYEFLFPSEAFEQTFFTVEKGHVGLLDFSSPKNSYPTIYSKLSKTNSFRGYDEVWYDMVECNGMDVDVLNVKDTGQFTPLFMSTFRGYFQNASLEKVGDYFIVHDFVPDQKFPNEPIVIYDELGNARDSVRIDESGEQQIVYRAPELGGSYSGVFNNKSKSWVVPRLFSKIIKTENGFSCVRNYNDTISFWLYSLDGKIIFKKLSADSLVNNTEFMKRFTGIKFSASMVAKFPVNYPQYYGKGPVIINDKDQSGVFDINLLKWIIQPVNDLIDYAPSFYSYYTVVNNSRMGLCDLNGNVMIKPEFRKLEFSFANNGFIADDSLFFNGSPVFKAVPVDSLQLDGTSQLYNRLETSYNEYKATLLKDNLVVTEVEKRAGYFAGDQYYGNYEYYSKFICYSRSVNLNDFKQKDFKTAIELMPWKTGYIIKDTLANWCFVNQNNEVITITKNASLSAGKNYLYSVTPNEGFYFDDEKNFVFYNMDEDPSQYSSKLIPAGYKAIYFDGESVLDLPADFYLLAVNKSKTGFGYTLTKVPGKSSLSRKYVYFNFNNRTFTDCEFEFAPNSKLEVADVNGYFVFMETDFEKQTYTFWHVEEDLKTIRSSFKELKYYHCQTVSNPLTQTILFEIGTKTDKQMFFDKEFGFILEADKGAYEVSYPHWNRLFMTYNKNVVKMNLKGQIVNK